MKHHASPATPSRPPSPSPAAPAGSGANPFEVEFLARSVWLLEGGRPEREDRCREEVACQWWLTRYLAPADRSDS